MATSDSRLRPEDHASLAKMIDATIEEIPTMAGDFQTLKRNPSLMLKEESDFIFGCAWSSLFSRVNSFLVAFPRQAAKEEVREATKIIIESLPKVRQAIMTYVKDHRSV